MTTQNELCSRIRSIITDNRYLTLGACLDDEVWVAPLAYYVEPDYSFVYYSSKESKHSKFIEKNNVVSCSIFNSSLPSDDVDGMQFVGEVSQVPSNELVEVVPKYFLQFLWSQVSKVYRRTICLSDGILENTSRILFWGSTQSIYGRRTRVCYSGIYDRYTYRTYVSSFGVCISFVTSFCSSRPL